MRSLLLSLIVLTFLSFTACSSDLNLDQQIAEFKKAEQDLLFQMINDTDGLGANGQSVDILEIDLIENSRVEPIDALPINGFNELEGEGELVLNPSISSGDQIVLRNGKFEIVNANPLIGEIPVANYRIQQDLVTFARLSFRHPDENIDNEFFTIGLLDIDEEAQELSFVIRQGDQVAYLFTSW